MTADAGLFVSSRVTNTTLLPLLVTLILLLPRLLPLLQLTAISDRPTAINDRLYFLLSHLLLLLLVTVLFTTCINLVVIHP